MNTSGEREGRLRASVHRTVQCPCSFEGIFIFYLMRLNQRTVGKLTILLEWLEIIIPGSCLFYEYFGRKRNDTRACRYQELHRHHKDMQIVFVLSCACGEKLTSHILGRFSLLVRPLDILEELTRRLVLLEFLSLIHI